MSLSSDELLKHATEFTFNALPEDVRKSSDESYYFDVKVVVRGEGLWAVMNNGKCFNAKGQSEHEGLPSGRTKRFKKIFRFSLEEAIVIAQEIAPTLKLGRYSLDEFVESFRKYEENN